MRYSSMYHSELSATSSDAKVISANYIEHPLFSFMDDLCCGFHYVFMKYVPETTCSRGYALRSAIKDFLAFRQEHNNRLHPDLHLKSMEGLGAEHFNLFMDYLRRKGQTLSAARALKTSILKASKENDDGLPLLTLPSVISSKTNQREPLSEQGDASFQATMRQTVDALKQKIEFRRQVSSAAPYTIEEIRYLIPKLLDNKSTRFEWAIDPARALRTLFDIGYPFNVTKAEFADLRRDLSLKRWVIDITRPSDFVLSCCMPRSYSVLRKHTPASLTCLDMMRLYYPSRYDQAALALFIQRQTGWNKESIRSIDRDHFLHPLSEVAQSDVVLIISEKNKGQAIGMPMQFPKTVSALSNRTNYLSAYNLIRLARELSEPLADIVLNSHRIGLDNPMRSSVFLCLRELESDWEINEAGPDNRVHSLNNNAYWSAGIAEFLAGQELVDAGLPLKTAADLDGRLRVTWQYYHAKQAKHPLSLSALMLNHSSVETTSAHYDSSAKALKDRKVRYQSIQEELLNRFHSGKFHGIIASTRAKSIDPTFRIFTILGHMRALWACIDSSKPDYPDAVDLPQGERCGRLDKCLFCSRIYVLGDSLPFLMERLSTLRRAVEADEERQSLHQNEIEILEYLVSKWDFESAVADALVYRRGFEALLPYDMRSLISYIED